MTLRMHLTLCFGLLLVGLCGCGSSTPGLSNVVISKDKAGTQAASTFKADDTFYGISNATSAGKGKVTGRLLVEDVEGQPKGPIPGLEQTLEVEAGTTTATFTYSPPTAGWPKGKYKIEVVLLNDKGEQVELKSGGLSVP